MAKNPKKKNKRKENKKEIEASETSKPLAEKKLFNIIYTVAMLLFFVSGITLMFLSNAFKNDILVYISLALVGLGIILLVQRSVYKQTAPPVKKDTESEDDSLRLRRR